MRDGVEMIKLCLFAHVGCGFVKYSSKETAMAAINGLNGTYIMRVSCESHKYLTL